MEAHQGWLFVSVSNQWKEVYCVLDVQSQTMVLYNKEGRGRAIGAAVDYVDVKSDTMGMLSARVAVDGKRAYAFKVSCRSKAII